MLNIEPTQTVRNVVPEGAQNGTWFMVVKNTLLLPVATLSNI